MKGNRDVIVALEKAQQYGRRTAIATVVGVAGSAYRREGAKMVIDENGDTTGLISGGCLEPDVVETAKQVIETGTPLMKQYDMDEETVWGLGLGCPGVVDVFIELVDGEGEE